MSDNGQIEASSQGSKTFPFRLFSQYRSQLMGIQICLIIFFHFTETCMNSGVHDSGVVAFFYTYIRSSGVDLFLLISGFGLYYSWKKQPELSQFYIRRFSRLLVPYFLLAIPAWAIYYVATGNFDLGSYLADLFFITFFTEGEKWIWYIFMAVVCYALFPCIFNFVDTARDRFDAVIRIAVLCLISTMFLLLLKLYQPDLYDNINIAVSRFPAFFIGVLFGRWSYEGKSTSLGSVVVFTVVAVILNIPLDLANASIIGVYTRAMMNLAFCMLGLYAVQTIKKKRTSSSGVLSRLFAWLGTYTLEIYMTHVVIRRFLGMVGFPTYRISSELLLVVLSLILSVALAKVAQLVRPSFERLANKAIAHF